MTSCKEAPIIKTEEIIHELTKKSLWKDFKEDGKDIPEVCNAISIKNDFSIEETTEYDSENEMELVHWYLLEKKRKKESFHDPNDNKRNGVEQLTKSNFQLITNGNDVIRRYKCPDCPRYFASNYLLRLHYDSEHLHKFFSCSFCREQFINYRRRQRHILTKHQLFETPRKCNFSNCAKTFKNPVSLREHILSVHKKNDKKCYKCDQCPNEKFLHQSALNKHMLLKHSPRTPEGHFPCTFSSCSWVSKNYICFRRHLKVHQNQSLQYSCDRPDCSKKFSCFTDLVKHRHSQHNNSLFTCDECQKKFFTYKKYQSHLLQHETMKTKLTSLLFLCPVVTCGKTFSSKRNIYEHIIHIHLRLKSYQCTYCSHNFTTFNAAKHHLKKFHTIESQTESMTNVRIIYNISFLNTEEAIQRVTTAFYNQDFRSSILRPNGIGLQLTEELEKKLIQISKDTSYGVIRKKRISNSTRVKENPHFPMTCIKNHSKSHSISNNVKNTMEKIHVDIKGFKETPANKNLCLHKRKRHLKS